ncbi:TolC family protein [Salinimicrobium gaetbulicola]|uniref:TolC family protein n=1 Tax=Salinimicrobium gaetbulicola TaxID=999702 RepID=A0ABW3IFX1_9FLAO
MKRIFKWMFFLPALVTFHMAGQETVLSKDEAVKAALESNYGIKISSNQVEIAENNQSIWNSGYLPSLTGLAGASYDVNDRTTDIQGEETIEQNDVENELYRGSLNVDYVLFDGLGRYYNFKSLKEEYNLSRLEARETVENTILQLFTVYFEIARLYENIDVLEEGLKISRDRELRAQYQYEYGQANNLAVLNARVDVNNDSINLIQARQQLQNTKRDLNVLLDREMEELGYVVDTTVTFIPKLQLENLIAQAAENNVRILQSESSIAISEYDIKVNRSGYLPSVGLTGSYGWNQNIGGPTAFFPGSTTTTTGLSAGVNLTWNIFDGGRTRVQTKNSRIVNDNQKLLKEQVELEVRRDIANALGTYENKLYIFHVQEENVATNLDNFNRTQEQYKLGQVTSIEFRQAQINLLNAETSLNLAKYEAKLAELELLRLTGQLLNVEY